MGLRRFCPDFLYDIPTLSKMMRQNSGQNKEKQSQDTPYAAGKPAWKRYFCTLHTQLHV